MTAVSPQDRNTTDSSSPASQDARAEGRSRASDATRRCLACGEMKPRAELIRFVIGPDDAVYPDLAENLPGHGLWVTASVEAIRLAVKKNLFAKAAKASAHPAATLPEDTLRLMRKRCLDLLGMAKGAGAAVLGEAQTEAAMRANKLGLYLHATDAMRQLDNRYQVSECAVFTRDELGSAFGYDVIVYAGLAMHGLTSKVKQELHRLRSMTALLNTQTNDVSGANPAGDVPAAEFPSETIAILGKNEG